MELERHAGPGEPPDAEVGARFFEAILEHPENDSLRQVYADWLIEHGDPRGEFILLQCREAAGLATPAERTRAKRLLREHQAAWLGDAAPGLARCVFEKGFLASCALGRPGVSLPALGALVGHPVLATVRELHSEYGEEWMTLPVITHPVLRSLRSIGVRVEELGDLLTRGGPWPFEHVTIIDQSITEVLDEFPRLDRTRSLPRLRALTLRTKWASQEWLGNWVGQLAAFRRGLSEVGLDFRGTPSMPVPDFGAFMLELWNRPPPGLETVRVTVGRVQAALHQEAGQLRLEVNGPAGPAAEFRARLSASLTPAGPPSGTVH